MPLELICRHEPAEYQEPGHRQRRADGDDHHCDDQQREVGHVRNVRLLLDATEGGHRVTRNLLGRIAVAASLSLGVVTFAGASAARAADPHPLEFTRGLIQALGLGPALCAGTILAPTIQCAVYDPATEAYFNPYTDDGSSPGILGFGSMLGLL